jgi:plasmid stability protein
MKSITIHKLEPDLAERLEKKAKRDGRSLNRTVKSILRNALGLSKHTPEGHKDDFMDLFGTWSDEEAATFNARTHESRQVKTTDWNR